MAKVVKKTKKIAKTKTSTDSGVKTKTKSSKASAQKASTTSAAASKASGSKKTTQKKAAVTKKSAPTKSTSKKTASTKATSTKSASAKVTKKRTVTKKSADAAKVSKTSAAASAKSSKSSKKTTTKKTKVAGAAAPATKSKSTTRKKKVSKAAAAEIQAVAEVAVERKAFKLVQRLPVGVKRKVTDGVKGEPLLRYQQGTPPQQETKALTEAELIKCKSGLGKKDLREFRTQLLLRRAEILGDVASLEIDARKEDGEGISYDHLADAGSDNFNQEFDMELAETERKLIRKINEALERMANGYYGVCVESGQPIGKPRLTAKPWAKWCIDVARVKEKLGLL